MRKNNRLRSSRSWIDLAFVERERTPKPAIEVGIRLRLAGLSLSNTKRELEKLGVERSRTAIHNWVQTADLQPTSDTTPNQIAVEKTVIRVNGERCWLYAAVNPEMNELLHVRLFQTLTTQLTLLFLRELREKQQVEHATFLVDGARHLHGNRNSAERVFREVKRRTSSFSNAFRNTDLDTVESWLQASAVWHNSCQS